MSMSEEELTAIVTRVVAELQGPTPTPLAIDPTHFQVLTGQVIAADHINSLANQSVPKYPTLASLTADWPAPPVGSLAYLQDINALFVYDNQITGGTNTWHVSGGMRMGYGSGPAQSIPASADTLVKITSFAGAANKPGRGTWAADGSVTLPATGTYLVSGNVTWTQNPTGERRLYVKRYHANVWDWIGVAGGTVETNVSGTTALRQGVTAMVVASAGEKVGLFARQNSGAALALYMGTGNADAPHLGVHLLGSE